MTTRIVCRKTGGPEVLEIEQIDLQPPAPGEIQVRQTAVGLNYIDTYFRTGLYPSPVGLPFSPGLEAAGVVEAVGDGVTDIAVGQRVAYGTGPLGAYATRRNMPAAKVVPVPDSIDDQTAAAMMLKGMTAQYLLRQTYEVKAGDTILFHAAAGGVGLIACQWAKKLGATVIGTAGTQEKADLARAHGADHVILYNDEDFAERVRELTRGEGVPVVYDGVGKATFDKSLDCLRPRGLMVSFGNASGAVADFNLGILSQKGSLYVTRPTLMTYTASVEELRACAADVMDVVGSGDVRIDVRQTFALTDARKAHESLEGRETTGA
ncbi:MAG: quinone oxidoreductase, partial [Geminicoccaceae bacterium]|nr:quinone oxidoreductase [Geminicoccaceae bacterium]